MQKTTWYIPSSFLHYEAIKVKRFPNILLYRLST